MSISAPPSRRVWLHGAPQSTRPIAARPNEHGARVRLLDAPARTGENIRSAGGSSPAIGKRRHDMGTRIYTTGEPLRIAPGPVRRMAAILARDYFKDSSTSKLTDAELVADAMADFGIETEADLVSELLDDLGMGVVLERDGSLRVEMEAYADLEDIVSVIEKIAPAVPAGSALHIDVDDSGDGDLASGSLTCDFDGRKVSLKWRPMVIPATARDVFDYKTGKRIRQPR
jgi:hypothetical protein